jgi:drug/metabolite transporter (DMT)-like permease
MNTTSATFCVLLFSVTVPATRIAALAIGAGNVAGLRLLGAALVCSITIVLFDRWLPPRRILPQLFLVSLGSVLGFSYFVALAMRHVPATHGVIAMAALPALTAVYSSFRDRTNPGLWFWIFCAAGSLLSLSFFFLDQSVRLGPGDLFLIGAVAASALGYVEGGRLSRGFGGRRIMSWAVLLASPFAFVFFSRDAAGIWQLLELNPAALFAISYLALISQSLGMFLWYRVLARGPMAKVAMTQLLQPFFSLAASTLLLGEPTSRLTWAIAGLVAACVFGANRQKATVSIGTRVSEQSGATLSSTERRRSSAMMA